MSTPVWPATLPQMMPIDTEEASEENRIATETDWGPKRVRRRYTSIIKHLAPPASKFVLTGTQKNTLHDFYDNTLLSGTKSFEWGTTGPTPDYSTGGTYGPETVTTPVLFRLDGRPAVVNVRPGATDADRLYLVSMSIEILPPGGKDWD